MIPSTILASALSLNLRLENANKQLYSRKTNLLAFFRALDYFNKQKGQYVSDS